MNLRFIYGHDVFTSAGRVTKGDIVTIDDAKEAKMYQDRDWAIPTDDDATVHTGIEENVDD